MLGSANSYHLVQDALTKWTEKSKRRKIDRDQVLANGHATTSSAESEGQASEQAQQNGKKNDHTHVGGDQPHGEGAQDGEGAKASTSLAAHHFGQSNDGFAERSAAPTPTSIGQSTPRSNAGQDLDEEIERDACAKQPETAVPDSPQINSNGRRIDDESGGEKVKTVQEEEVTVTPAEELEEGEIVEEPPEEKPARTTR